MTPDILRCNTPPQSMFHRFVFPLAKGTLWAFHYFIFKQIQVVEISSKNALHKRTLCAFCYIQLPNGLAIFCLLLLKDYPKAFVLHFYVQMISPSHRELSICSASPYKSVRTITIREFFFMISAYSFEVDDLIFSVLRPMFACACYPQ